ncbi:hypothetical protein CISIN_1g035303mg [Citrus sinensis]|uniref:Uncharacterized protein n=1 Tax=Citrus sinensis TaxID=2711 RepID=A0A067DET9_CITSI|nr:hypothetical protein CISIN_1g035303mg [Citrus sinensis]
MSFERKTCKICNLLNLNRGSHLLFPNLSHMIQFFSGHGEIDFYQAQPIYLPFCNFLSCIYLYFCIVNI